MFAASSLVRFAFFLSPLSPPPSDVVDYRLPDRMVNVKSIFFLVGLVLASQVILSSEPATGNIAYTLPTDRTFLLNVPTAYRHGEPHPLVISFHGGMFMFCWGIKVQFVTPRYMLISWSSWWIQREAAAYYWALRPLFEYCWKIISHRIRTGCKQYGL